MKGKIIFVIAIFLIASMATANAGKKDFWTIQSGEITDSGGNPLTVGYDEYGYNYQAHIFNGYYENYARPATPVTESDTWLQMKWNDAWLSNKDYKYEDPDDFLLDRHYGYDTYIGSGAWLTNHMHGQYVDPETGETIHWTYFVKIVAAPADAYTFDGYWYSADDVEIGPVIWGSFAIVQEVENDPGLGLHGVQYLSDMGPGLGLY